MLACGVANVPVVEIPQKPMRIVSLDYCSDQFVLKLVDRDQILAVSPDATASFSYMRERAIGLPTVRSIAEDVLLLKPDLIVRSYGGGPNAEEFFKRVGVPVLSVGWAADLDGIKRVALDMATQLHVPEEGNKIVADIEARIQALKSMDRSRSALYMTPTGVTSGPGSLIHEMLVAAGFDNFQKEPGWRSLPLERLAYEQPDLVAAAFFESPIINKDAWSAMAHPVARKQMIDQPTVRLQGAWTSCGGWFLMDAVEALANASLVPKIGTETEVDAPL